MAQGYAGSGLSVLEGLGGLSAGTQSVSTGTVVFSNSNGITFGMSGSSRITASHNAITAGIQSISAGTTRATAGEVVFSNSNGLSFGLDGVTMTGSYTVPSVPPETPFGISAGTQSVSTGTMVFSDSNGISFGMSGSSRITASYTVPSTAGLISAANISAGTTSNNLTAVVFSNANGVSFGLDGSTVTGSIASPVAETPFGLSAGTQSVSTGTLIFSDSNGISFGMSGSSRITASYTVPTQTNQTLGLYMSSNTTSSVSSGTVDARSLTFRGVGVASVGYSGGEVIISVPAGGGGITGIVVSAGTTQTSLSSIVFSNSNNISFGIDGSTITASASAQSAQTVGLYGLGNTTQNSSTTLDARTLSFNGLGIVTVGYSGGSIQVSANAIQSVSAGTTRVTSGEVIWSNSNSISFGLNGQTVTASYAPPYISSYYYRPTGAMTSSAMTLASASIQMFFVPVPMTFTRVDIPILISISSSATTNTGALVISSLLVLYTRSASTIGPIVGVSGTTTHSHASDTSNWSSLTGAKFASFALATALTPGYYWAGFQLSTANTSSIGLSTTASPATISILLASDYTASGFHEIGSTANTSLNIVWQGLYTTTISATSQTLQVSHISQSGTPAARANFHMLFRNA